MSVLNVNTGVGNFISQSSLCINTLVANCFLGNEWENGYTQ